MGGEGRKGSKKATRDVAAGPQVENVASERDLDSRPGVLGLMGESSKEQQDGGEFVG